MLRTTPLSCLLASALVLTLAAPAPAGQLSEEELAGATLVGIVDEPITLVDGRWEGPPAVAGGASRPVVELVPDFRLVGDLDADGLEDTTVLLARSSGGSGVRVHLAVVGRRGDAVRSLGSAGLGDRTQVRAGRVAGSRVLLELVQAGPDDAACCPSQLVTKIFALQQGRLVLLSEVAEGTLSLGTLGGVRWVLSHFAPGAPAPSEPQVTLELVEDRLAGKAGCNRYFTTPTPGETPGSLSLGPVGSTMMMCPEAAMEVERRYLKALEAATGFGFLNGRLALRGAEGPLLYEARDAGEADAGR